MQIKTTGRYYFILTSKAIIRETEITGVGEDMKILKSLYMAGRSVKFPIRIIIVEESTSIK